MRSLQQQCQRSQELAKPEDCESGSDWRASKAHAQQLLLTRHCPSACSLATASGKRLIHQIQVADQKLFELPRTP